MKLKSTLLFVFICLSIIVNAQTNKSRIYTYFNSPSGENVSCGNRTIVGEIYEYIENSKDQRQIVFEADNKFYLEIASENSTIYTKILAQKVDIGRQGIAQFVLPDSLQIGKTYLLKMSSTNPAMISTSPYQIRFGIGLMPFTVDFKQEVSFYKESPQTYLNYSVKIKNLKDSTETPKDNLSLGLKLKLSNGITYNGYIYSATRTNSIYVIAKDSINTYRIEEAVNTCGTKGEISGEAKVVRKEFLDKIYIKSSSNQTYCKDSKMTIEVVSKSLAPNSKLRVEFSSDYYFSSGKSTFVDAILDNNSNLTFQIPSNLPELTYSYYRIISNSPQMTSNPQSIYVTKKTNIVYTYNGYDTNGFYISFSPYNSVDRQYYYSSITEAIINGVDVSKTASWTGNYFRLPTPKRDTVLNFTKISNSCGTLEIATPTITIKPNNYVFVNFTSKAESVCQGKTVEFGYGISNSLKANDIVFSPEIYISGSEYSETTKTYSGAGYGYFIGNIKYSVNQEKKTILVTIPSDIDEQIKKLYGTKKLNIQNLYVRIYPYSNNSETRVGYQYLSTEIKLLPKLKLTTPSITLANAGYTNIPMEFVGGNQISYTLSDGQKGITNHIRTGCNGCQLLNSGDQNVRVYADKNTVFRITTAENECGLASISGETNVIVNATTTTPTLLIDELQLPKIICASKNTEIPLLKSDNIPANTQFILFQRYINNGTEQYNIQTNVTAPYVFKPITTSYSNVEIWLQSTGGNIKSNIVSLQIESTPNNIDIESNYGVKSYDGSTEIIHGLNTDLSDTRIYFRAYGYGGNLGFTFNGKPYKSTYFSNNYAEISQRINFQKDTLITLNSVSNACGTFDLNRKFKIIKVQTTISAYEESAKNFIQTSNCSGSKRTLTFNYNGEIPKKDSLIVQLAKYTTITNRADFNRLQFFDVPTQQGKSELIYTIPDTCAGNYIYRVRSAMGVHLSSYNYGLYSIGQKPIVKLTTLSGKLEVTALPGAYLILQSNLQKSRNYNVVLNDDNTYSNYDFGNYETYVYDRNSQFEKITLENLGRYFTPTKTTIYSVKSVYNQCGFGSIEGSTTIIVPPTISNSFSKATLGNTFCSGDSLSLDFKYFGEFPKDTLMGVYLHNYSKSAYNQELTTFKNNTSAIKIKLPSDINSGDYFIQTRKKSRNKIYTVSSQDSLARVNSKLNLDSDRLSLQIGTAPNISLTGSTEIFVGNSATLFIKQLNRNGQDVTSDSVLTVDGMAYYYDLSNGNQYSGDGRNIIVSPQKTETFSIVSAKNACGVGKVVGSATITVLPKSDKRIESIGYARKTSEQYQLYVTNPYFCAGSKDSLDIKVYGVDSKTDFSKYKVLLSNKDGANYTPIKTTKTMMVEDSAKHKIIRLWHEIPDDVVSGNNYRIKGVADDESILSTPIASPVELEELATASLTGNAMFLPGEKVNATVKLTGKAPWLLSVTDKDNKFVYNTMPTKQDSLDNFKNFKDNSTFSNEVKLELLPEKANTYKVTKVLNVCGLGKIVSGEFSVDLILSNEPLSQNLVQIYPNPTTDNIIIDISSLSESTSIELYDINGRVLNKQIINKNEVHQQQNLNFRQYNSGIYLLKINSGKFLQTYRVVKQ